MSGRKILWAGFAVLMSITAGSCKSTKPRLTANELEPIPGGGTEWTSEVDAQSGSLVSPPEKIPAFSKFLLGFAERGFDKEVMPGRVLTWSTDLGVASGALELYIEKGAAKILDPRLVYLLRMQVSFAASCPFAIDLNSSKYAEHGITEEEIQAMQLLVDMDSVTSFSEQEKVALRYAIAMTKTPVSFDEQLLSDVRRLFSHEEIVAMAALAAKVNYWARFIEAMRIKPAGFTDDPVLRLEDFQTFDTGE
ncbi:MAG: carboxymuconolactone decarboxylase family protein [Clostridia bacterium]|jgi:alkylhydroperoxidase family enzyme